MLKQFHKLMSPEDTGTGTISTELSEDAIAAELAEGATDDKLEEQALDIIGKKKPEEKKEEKPKTDDDEIEIVDDEEKPKDKEKPKEGEEDEDDLAELERELKGPTDEQLELMTPARRKDILKAYPDLFEKFPYLETAYYRDQRFTEFFPTFKDAEQASQDAKSFAELNTKIESGDLESIVSGLKTKGESFNKFIDNLMPMINKIDRGAFEHVVGNTAKQIIQSMFEEAETSNNDALKTSATIMHQFLFGTSKFTHPTTLSTTKSAENNPEADKLKKEREEYENRKFQDAQNGLVDRINNVIKATIIKWIDPATKANPNGVMTEYVKNAATREALQKTEQLISKDTRFRSILDRLWEDAAKKNYDKASMDKIKSACISKARTLLPSVIKTARNEALKGMGKTIRESSDKDSQSKPKSTRPDNSGKPNGDQKGKVPAGMTEEEYLLSDVDE